MTSTDPARSGGCPRVALVVPGLEQGGGVPVVAMFLHRVLAESGRYLPELVSIAMSSRDDSSVRLLAPNTWHRGVRVRDGEWSGKPLRHVGASLVELEFQRYRPRRVLTDLLRSFDLVQVVAGVPAWALVTRDVGRPVGLQVATLVAVERVAIASHRSGVLAVWQRLMTRLLTRWEVTALRRVDAVFVENQWMYDRLRGLMDASKVIFAPPGIDTDVFRPTDSGPRRDESILSVGRLSDPRKNVALLFRAYRQLLESTPAAPELVLAGNAGPTPDDWELARSLGIADRVRFLENVTRAELVELYQHAALYVLSSDEEGLGLVILEAMACGCPVVSTDCGGPSTSVVQGETGFLVPLGDAEALAEKMRALVTDAELRRRMGTRARERAVSVFSLEATGRLFLDWFDRALQARADRNEGPP